MNRFIHFGIGAVLLVLVCLTSCRGDGPTSAKPITTSEAPETTETANVVCNTLKTNNTCCSNTGCSWIVCFNKAESENHTACHDLSNSTDKQKAAADCNVTVDVIDQSDTCLHTPTTTPNTTSTTTASTSTTSAQTTSTAEPTTTQLPVPACEGITKKEECCGTQGLKLKCQYVNCTTKDKKSTTPLCLNSTKKASECTPESPVICNSNQTSTTQAPTTSTSAPTKAPPTTPAPHTGTTPHGQHFDGASFFGGMILMAGLFIIAFFAIKFYRARKDRSYRTL